MSLKHYILLIFIIGFLSCKKEDKIDYKSILEDHQWAFAKQTINNQVIYPYKIFIKSIRSEDVILNKNKAVISGTITSENIILGIDEVSFNSDYKICSLNYNENIIYNGYWGYFPNDSVELIVPMGIEINLTESSDKMYRMIYEKYKIKQLNANRFGLTNNGNEIEIEMK